MTADTIACDEVDALRWKYSSYLLKETEMAMATTAVFCRAGIGASLLRDG
jgi:hypothetical protein